MEKELRRNPQRKVKLLLLVCAAALLGGLGLGAGLGIGGSGFSASPAEEKTDGQSDKKAEMTAAYPALNATQEPVTDYVIEVNEESILFRGQPYSLENLREALLNEYTGEEVYELWDNHAIKADYDSVKAILEELFIEYIEK